MLTFFLSCRSQASPNQLDHLSRLPNELLHQIWDDTYSGWEEGGNEGSSKEKLTGPLSKRLLGFQQRGLYRTVEIRRWTGPHSFAVLVETVTKQPHLGAMIESLRFDISPDSLQGQDHELDGPAVRAFLDLLPKLRHLTLAGGISMNGTVLQMYSQFTTPFHILVFILDHPNVVAFSNELISKPESRWRNRLPPAFSTMQSAKISHLSIMPRDSKYRDFGDRADDFPSNFLTINFRRSASSRLDTNRLPALSSDQPASPSTSSLLPKPSTPAQSDRPPVPYVFSQIEQVLLKSETSEISSPLLDILPRFPIKDLILEIKNVVPISSLLSLVSECSTLRHLVLHYYGYPGSIGTRVSTVEFNSVFPPSIPIRKISCKTQCPTTGNTLTSLRTGLSMIYFF